MTSCSLPIRISSPKVEGLLQVSKWLKVQVFLDEEEMRDLLQHLKMPYFVVVSEPVLPEERVISSEEFLKKYAEYVAFLKQGKVPSLEEFRRYFSCAIASNLDSFYAIAVQDKFLIKPIKPVIQLQAHHFFYSDLDDQFHPMVLSPDSISWGLQFSYPQMTQDLQTRQIAEVIDSPDYPNTALFTKLMKWMRNSTLPTPFEVNAKRINSSIRVGKKSFAWIKNHPQLHKKNICVYCIKNQ